MAWTEQEISTYQIHNNKMLEEINATLQPPDKNKLNIGIFAFGQQGDAMTCSSVLKYKDELWPDKNIIWFCNNPVADVFKYSKEVNEIRPWLWAGNGLPIGSEDYWPMLMTEDNRLNQTLKLNFKDTADISEGYFPCPFMLPVQKRHGIDYPNCSRKVFQVPDDWEWHPVLNFSEEEATNAFEFIESLPEGDRIFFETFAGSDQSRLSHEMVIDTMQICREKTPNCIFIFASHKYLRAQESFPEGFFEQPGVYSCANFTVRQCAQISDYCSLIISVSSGVTVACLRWGRIAVPVIQFCGSFICSQKSLADGSKFELVTYDDKLLEDAKTEFGLKLIYLLNKPK